MDLGLAAAVWPWVWLAVAILFAVVEVTILGGSMVLLPFAISAFVSSVIAFYDAPIVAQWLVFGAGGAVLFAVFARWASMVRTGNVLPVGVGANRLVGRTAIVTEPIGPVDHGPVGQVTVDSEVWGAVSTVDVAIEAGAKVTIVDLQGTRVLVEPATVDDTGARQ
ncbi:NfeD family protein [Salsipaludibacter albus]|uniref:NfeD family protein n=1 Tax=Salsipaludibacter albus TaxID=2849650 RepID=UPI001EE3F5CE|nr:NfeD family protein [Salsipaludibacter albus]MBY5160871.1 NfeD family protein [Salsipaludibacter albus]